MLLETKSLYAPLLGVALAAAIASNSDATCRAPEIGGTRVVILDCSATCRSAPLGGKKAPFYQAIAARMKAAYGISTREDVQRGSYRGGSFRFEHHYFGSEQEIEKHQGVSITDFSSGPYVGPRLLLLGNASPQSVARVTTLATATVSYFSKIDEGTIAPKINKLLEKAVAASPNPDEWNGSGPFISAKFGNVSVIVQSMPQIMNTTSITIDGWSCK